MNALHEQFVVEARELIQQATDDLIALEREGFAIERIDRIFRAFHTLKGSAGVVELPAMSLTLHAAEDLLAAIHGGQMTATSDIIDRALACLDQVSRWVNDFEAEGSLPSHAGEDARSMAEQLRDLLSESSRKKQRPSVGHSAIAASGQLSEWVAGLIASQRAKVSEWVRDHPTGLFAVSYEPHAGCFFDGADPIQLMRQVPSLLAFHIEEREPWPQLADLDPFACNLRLQCISGENRAELARIFRLVPDQVRIVEVPLKPSQLKQRTQSDRDMTDLVRAVIEEQRQMLRISAQGEHLIGRIGAAARAAANALRYDARPDLAEPIERAGATATSQGTAAPLLSVLEETLEPFPLGTPAADQAAARRESSPVRAREVASLLKPLASRSGIEDRCAGQSGRRAHRCEERSCASGKARGSRDRGPGARPGRQARAGGLRPAYRRNARGYPAIADGSGRAGLSIVSTPRPRYVARARQEG